MFKLNHYPSPQIQRLQLEVANVRQSADEKDGQVSELLTALEERQNMLQTSNSRIGELEDLQTQLEAQVSQKWLMSHESPDLANQNSRKLCEFDRKLK